MTGQSYASVLCLFWLDSGDNHFLVLFPNLTFGMHPLKIFTLKIWQSVGLMLLEMPLLGRNLFILLGMSTQR